MPSPATVTSAQTQILGERSFDGGKRQSVCSSMGVHNLWKILGLVGRPMRLDELSGRVLAVDASIWLNQFIKAIAEDASKSATNVPLKALLGRILKLLYYGIKPVFVFDGPTPAIKLATTASRKQRREQSKEDAERARQKSILQKFLAQGLKSKKRKRDEEPKEPTKERRKVPVTIEVSSDLEGLNLSDRYNFSSYSEGETAQIAYLVPQSDVAVLSERPSVTLSSDKESVLERLGISEDDWNQLPEDVQADMLGELAAINAPQSRTSPFDRRASDRYSAQQVSRLVAKGHVRRRMRKSRVAQSSPAPKNGGERRVQSEGATRFVFREQALPLPPVAEISEISDENVDWMEEEVNAHVKEAEKEREKSPIDLEQLELSSAVEFVENDPESADILERSLPQSIKNFDVFTDNEEVGGEARRSDDVDKLKGEEAARILALDNSVEFVDKVRSEVNFIEGGESEVEFEPVIHEISSNLDSEKQEGEVGGEALEGDMGDEGEAVIEDIEAQGENEINIIDEEEEIEVEEGEREEEDDSVAEMERDIELELSAEREAEPATSEPPNTELIRRIDELRGSLTAESAATSSLATRMALQSASLSDKLLDATKRLLQCLGLPFITAPGEADAQCALLESLGLVEGTITDDSDLFLFGAEHIYRNCFSTLRDPEAYLMSEIEEVLGLTREHLICLALLLGSDYTHGVKGVGVVSSLEILAEFNDDDCLAVVENLVQWLNSPAVPSEGDLHASFTRSHRKLKGLINSNRFKAEMKRVRTAYIQPEVDRSTEPFTWSPINVSECRMFFAEKFGWNHRTTDLKLAHVLDQVEKCNAEARAQGTLKQYFTASNKGPRLIGRSPKKMAHGRLSELVQRLARQRHEKLIPMSDLLSPEELQELEVNANKERVQEEDEKKSRKRVAKTKKKNERKKREAKQKESSSENEEREASQPRLQRRRSSRRLKK